MKKTVYEVTLKLTTDLLGTNPLDPNVRDKHLLQKQNELITKFNKTKGAGASTYAGSESISEEISAKELEDTYRVISIYIGRELTEEDKKLLNEDSKKFFEQEGISSSGATVFFRNSDGLPFIRGHMVKGHMKAASEAIYRATKKEKKEKGEGREGKWMDSISINKSLLNQQISVSYDCKIEGDVERDSNGKPVYLTRSLRTGQETALTSSEYIKAGAKIIFELTVLGDVFTPEILAELFEYGKISGLGQWRNSGHGQFVVDSVKKLNIKEEKSPFLSL